MQMDGNSIEDFVWWDIIPADFKIKKEGYYRNYDMELDV